MALRLVSKNTTRLEIGDEDYLVVKEDISRRDFNRLIARLPQGINAESGVDYATATAFADGLFEAFVVEWSVIDEDGEPVAPTVDNYQMLSREAASLVDEAITEHFNSLTPDNEEQTKSEGPSEE